MTKGTEEAIRRIQACSTLEQLRELWGNDIGRSGWHRSVSQAYSKKREELKETQRAQVRYLLANE